MNKELLAEAKRRYPIGTVIKCVKDGQRGVVYRDPSLYPEDDSIYTNYETDDRYQYLYVSGKWAEIISLPSEYLIGTSVKVILKGRNATQFNSHGCAYNGVYSIPSWESEIFTVCGKPKLYKGLPDKYQNCYPLAHNGKLVGYVYSEGIAPYKKEFILPEKWYIINNPSIEPTLRKWRGGSGYTIYKNDTIVMVSEKYWMSLVQVKFSHTEITFEQFKKYVLNINKQTNLVMKTFPITRSQFQMIYNVACSTWRSKITTMVQEKLGTFGTNCELSYEVVESMFKEATVIQSKVLIEIFPGFNIDKSISLNDKSSEELFCAYGKDNSSMIEIRIGGQYKNKAFYLDSHYKWEMKKDIVGDLCLIPTLK